MPLSISFPSWLKPEIIPGLPVRWYGLMYILAFGTAFYLYRKQIKERNFPMSDDDLSSMFFWVILSILAGARLFSTLIYHGDSTYWLKPWLIFWPFHNGKFTGLQGMSYHGGALFCLLSVVIYARVKRISFREISDMFAASVPLSYTFGRLGNFINAELYGRVTTGPLGMIFPHAAPLPVSENWVREAAEKTGVAITDAYINLPRHPSQLYEMLFEGIILWAIIWLLRNRKPFKGFLVGLYFLGYGFFRFFIEYFREPDSHLGYPLEFVKSALPTAYSHPPLSFSTGQIFCFFMILFGVIWLVIASRLPKEDNKEDVPVKEVSSTERNRLRKLRKKLR
jgi:phosphatidylglycerol:prolipoprotein diacylglycerol transferase